MNGFLAFEMGEVQHGKKMGSTTDLPDCTQL